MIILLLVVLGLCLGSFINALCWRIHEQSVVSSSKLTKKKKGYLIDLSISHGHSMCPKCHHKLAVVDLVPVLSWVVLRGRCRYCHQSISVQYPLVELITVGLFVGSYLLWSRPLAGIHLFEFIVWLGILVGLIALALFDTLWQLLPDRIVYPLIYITLAELIVTAVWSHQALETILGGVWGVLVLSGIFYVLYAFSKGKLIGGGDVKLGIVLGLLVGGPLSSILVLFLASAGGSLTAVPLLLSGRVRRNSHIPFGPFLIAAAIVAQLYGSSIIDWYRNLYIS